MKIGLRSRIILGFILVSIMIPLISLFYWYFLQELSVPIQKDIPSSIQQLSFQTKLDNISQLVRYYDETLTQSARNYAFTGDKKWKDRYYQDAPKLDEAIKEAINSGDQQDKQYFTSIDSANIALVKMEEQSMGLVGSGEKEEAVKILESKNYWDQKAIYKKGIDDYVSYRGQQLDKATTLSISLLNSSEKYASDTLNYAISITILVSILGFIFSIIVGIVLSYSVEGDLEKYKLFFTSSKDALMTLSPPDWKFNSANKAALELFGAKDEKELSSFNPGDLSPEKQPDGQPSSDKAKKMIEIAMIKGSNFFEWTHKKYKGENFYATVLLTRIGEGSKAFLQATVRDISVDKKREIEISEKARELEQLNRYMVGRELKMIELKKQIKVQNENKREN